MTLDADYYVTPEKLEELKVELEELKSVKRIEVAKRLKRAKELGDLSENSEYIEAREEQSQVERRIFTLEQMLKNAVLIKKPEAKTGHIQIGSTIEVSKDGKAQKFTIVGSSETRPEAGLISNESPLGKAFLAKSEGDSVSIKTPSGTVTYTILKIE
jgi:transcription elongation factor GreA